MKQTKSLGSLTKKRTQLKKEVENKEPFNLESDKRKKSRCLWIRIYRQTYSLSRCTLKRRS